VEPTTDDTTTSNTTTGNTTTGNTTTGNTTTGNTTTGNTTTGNTTTGKVKPEIAYISTAKLMRWDAFIVKNQDPKQILESIYNYIEGMSLQMCSWYWSNIKTKRVTSLAIRAVAFILLVLGTVLPITVGALEASAEQKLFLTQLAVAFLATAGLMQLADRVFGWSSGWMRSLPRK
jgi:hypothetical protein